MEIIHCQTEKQIADKEAYIQQAFLLQNSEDYIVISKMTISIVGHEAAAFLSILTKIQDNFKGNNSKDSALLMPSKEEMYKLTTLSYGKQLKAIQKLKDCDLIFTESKGRPPKKYFTINNNLLQDILAQGEIRYGK